MYTDQNLNALFVRGEGLFMLECAVGMEADGYG